MSLPPFKILMVCLGNICRSPMAEGMMRQVAHEKGWNIVVDSCGTGGWHAGEHPDTRAIETMKKYKIDISALKARQFTVSDFTDFDLILTMDSSNYNDVIKLATNENEKQKVKLILPYSHGGKDDSVPDPWYGEMDGFTHVYQLLKEACTKIADRKYAHISKS